MASIFWLGQLLKGKASTYTITKQLHECIWLATYGIYCICALEPRTDLHSSVTRMNTQVVIKSARHFRLANESDVLKRCQSRTPSLRPLIDEIVDPSDPPALVLKHLDDDLWKASATQRLTRLEIKHVARNILEALTVLHDDGYVHTGMVFAQLLAEYWKALPRFNCRYQTRQSPG